MISKTQINERMKKKTNSYLVETIFLAKKNNLELASALSVPSRQQAAVNLTEINGSKSEIVLIPGKVLSGGEIESKKSLKVYALGFSEKAIEKLKKAGCETKTILEALKNLKKGEKLKGEILK